MDRRKLCSERLVWHGRASQCQDDPGQILRVGLLIRSNPLRRHTLICSSNAGYCFVDFTSPAAAAKALTLNGQLIPNSNRPFKLNWASGGGLADRRYPKPVPF